MAETEGTPLHLRCDLRPGDLGAVVRLHGLLYAREQGFDHRFEGYVAEGLARFSRDYDPARERLWVVEAADGRIVGCVAVVRASEQRDAAQLRWFLLDPAARGRGLGRRLLGEAVTFAEAAGYRSMHLWTLRGLAAAARLYRAFGFALVEEKPNRDWLAGRELVEQRYERAFPPRSANP